MARKQIQRSPYSGLLLSALLNNYTDSGVKPNPEYGLVGPTEGGTPLGSDKAFTGSNFLAKGKAANLNNELKYNNIQTNAQRASQLQYDKDALPTKLDELEKTGAITSKQRLALESELNTVFKQREQNASDIKTKAGRAEANDKLLTGEGIVANDDNLSSFNNNLSESRIAAKKAGAAKDASEAMLGQNKANLANDELGQNKSLNLQTSANRAKGEFMKSGEDLTTIPIAAASMRKEFQYKPELMRSEILGGNFKPMGGSGMLDIATGKTIPSPIDPAKVAMQEFMKQFSGITTGNGTPKQVPSGNTPATYIDPALFEVIDIGGEKFLQPRKK